MRRVIPGLSLALLFGLFASIQPAAAQITHFYVVIDVINCPSLPGPDEAPFDDVNHPCEPATGITFAVTNGDTGEAFGSCVSEVLDAPDAQARGQCLVLADIDTPLIVTEDTSTVPAGYLPVENSVAVTLSGTEPNPNMRFINVLQGGDEPPAQVDKYNLPIHVINCPDLPDDLPWEDRLGECEPGAGITFTLTDTGQVVGTCVTVVQESIATCRVPVDFGSTVYVSEDSNTLPEGYFPLEEFVVIEVLDEPTLTGEGPYATFVNELRAAPPAGDEPPPPSDAGAPPAQLPSTGTGPAGLMQLISFFR